MIMNLFTFLKALETGQLHLIFPVQTCYQIHNPRYHAATTAVIMRLFFVASISQSLIWQKYIKAYNRKTRMKLDN